MSRENTKIVVWSEIFLTGNEPEKYKTAPNRLHLLCAEGLCGWASASLDKVPENFGRGMAHIGKVLGITPLGDNLVKWSKEHPLTP